MNTLKKTGRTIFATGILVLGILCIIQKDFIVGRPPAWPETFTFNPTLAYISSAILIMAAIAILLKIKRTIAALLIAALIFLLSVLRHLPYFMNDWLNSYKAMALFGGALIIAGSFIKEKTNARQQAGTNEYFRKGLTITGTLLLAVFFIACGYAHFKFAAFIKDFIPAYIPFRSFWAYFCGICLFAGGVGILIPLTAKWAALLSGIMVAGWFVLLHIPRFIANTKDVSDRMGLFESFTFAGIFFALAGMLSERK